MPVIGICLTTTYSLLGRKYYNLLLCSLVKRKEKWQRAEEERISSLPDPSVPSGHTVMPDKERRETLNALQEGMKSY